ncbi:MAG: maleylpyruvate isomerase N-terminal domain-containing protein [Candidatus Dormibacteria bacterium]
MEPQPSDALGLARTAHRRLFVTAAGIDDETGRRPSRLPGWTVGHVLTHLARNADGHVRRLAGALEGREVPRYEGGDEQRDGEIAAGAGRSKDELFRDVTESARRLERIWVLSQEAGWPNAGLLAGDHFPTTGSPFRRLREVEMHHVDLGLGYELADWPEEYVAWELSASLERLPERLVERGDDRRFLAWLTGRGGWPQGLRLRPWL